MGTQAYAQAQAFICWTDTYTRTTAYGLGSDYTWEDWDSASGNEPDALIYVDGSKIVASSNTYESYLINRTIPGDVGEASFDFTTGSNFDSGYFGYAVILFEDDGSYGTGHQAFGIQNSLDSWWLTAYWAGTFTADDIRIDPLEFDTTYRVKATYKNGKLNAKVWKLSDPEPDYMLFGETIDFVPFNRAWLDLELSTNIASVDNVTFCIGPGPSSNEFAPSQALADITNTTPSGNAQADIKQTYRGYAQAQAVVNRGWGLAQAQAKIVPDRNFGQSAGLFTGRVPYHDTFTRSVSSGLRGGFCKGALFGVWGSNSPDPLAYVDGSKAIVPETSIDTISIPGQNIPTEDVYGLPITYIPDEGYAQVDIHTPANGTLSGRIPMFTLSFSSNDPSFPGSLSLGLYGTGTFFAGAWSYQIGNTNIFPEQATGYLLYADTWYTLKLRWTAAGAATYTLWNRTTGSEASPELTYSMTSNWKFAGTYSGYPKLELIGSHDGDDFYIDNLIISGIIPSGQAQARIAATSRNYGQAQSYVGHFQRGQAQARILQFDIEGVGQAQARINAGGVNEFQATGQAQGKITTTKPSGQAQARIGSFWDFAQAQAYMVKFRGNMPGNAQARIKTQRWVWGQSQGFIKPRLGFAQVLAYIKLNNNNLAQAQAYIVRSMRFGQAQSNVKQTYKGYGQAQARLGSTYQFAQAQGIINIRLGIQVGQALGIITGTGVPISQAQARIKAPISNSGQAKAQIRGATYVCGNSQAFIKRTISYAQAQGWIARDTPGYLVKYNGYVLPGYLQSEALISEQEIITEEVEKYDFSTFSEYSSLKNKIVTIRLLVTESTYGSAKEQVNKAATMLRSSRKDFVRLVLKRPDRYYMALTKTVSMSQSAGTGEKNTPYEVSFEAKPWQYGNWHTLTGTIDTDNVSRTFSNGTWTPAIINVTGTNITISGYSGSDFTGFLSVSGAVTNLVIDSENYSATINGVNRNDLMNNLDYAVYIAPGRTEFATTGVTSITVDYEDRWPL